MREKQSRINTLETTFPIIPLAGILIIVVTALASLHHGDAGCCLQCFSIISCINLLNYPLPPPLPPHTTSWRPLCTRLLSPTLSNKDDAAKKRRESKHRLSVGCAKVNTPLCVCLCGRTCMCVCVKSWLSFSACQLCSPVTTEQVNPHLCSTLRVRNFCWRWLETIADRFWCLAQSEQWRHLQGQGLQLTGDQLIGPGRSWLWYHLLWLAGSRQTVIILLS